MIGLSLDTVAIIHYRYTKLEVQTWKWELEEHCSKKNRRTWKIG